jgi:hypothetical protein
LGLKSEIRVCEPWFVFWVWWKRGRVWWAIVGVFYAKKMTNVASYQSRKIHLQWLTKRALFSTTLRTQTMAHTHEFQILSPKSHKNILRKVVDLKRIWNRGQVEGERKISLPTAADTNNSIYRVKHTFFHKHGIKFFVF